jgi:hypothetical protein
MPLRRSAEKLQKITLFLFERDVQRLKEIYTKKHTTYIRMLVRAHLTKRDAEIAAQGEALSDEIELDDEVEVVDIGEEDEVDIEI